MTQSGHWQCFIVNLGVGCPRVSWCTPDGRLRSIERDDKHPDVFVHISDVMEFMGDQLEVGQRVTFELGQDPKSGKTKAVNVRIS